MNTDTYVFMGDLFRDGRWFFAETKDLKTFTQGDFSVDFHARHGSVVSIARSELNAVLKHDAIKQPRKALMDQTDKRRSAKRFFL